MSDTSPIDRRKNATQASVIEERLRRDLSNAVFRPGEKLAIEALRDRYGAGASPVREALNRLSAEGWVKLSDQRGFSVPQVSDEELHGLTRARCLLNEITIREAIAHATEQSDEAIVLALHRLSRLPPRLPESPAQINPDWESRHRAFHASLIAACGSQRLIEFDASLFEQAARYRALSTRSRVHRDVNAEHMAIADAVLGRDAANAITLLNLHINRTADVVSEVAKDGDH